MDREKILETTERVYERIIRHYGESKHHNFLPFVSIEDTPYSDDEIPSDLYGEYCHILNEITLYWKNITSLELLARTLLHEYQHYLQSPSWMTRYYRMGHDYRTHPYEVKAFNEEENWKNFI